MAKLPVKLQKIFGGALVPASNIAQPGSTTLGSPVFSNDPAVLQALAAWVNGYAAQLVNAAGGLSSPVLEELNAILYVISYQLSYLKQAGVPEWDPTVTYFIGSWVNVGGVPYIAKTDNNTNIDPLGGSGPANWQTYASTLLGASNPLIKAWVIFDGRTGAIDNAFNVANVARTSAGKYRVTFTAPMPSAFYGFAGTCGTRPGAGWISGDDNTLNCGVSGAPNLRTAAQCDVYAWDRGDNATQDSSLIGVNFFGP